MPDNPQPTNDAVFALPDHGVVELRGPDAMKFAQAQFMSDVGSLEVGHWHWSGWLTPKGRVVALFAAVRIAEDCLWLVLPDAEPAPLAEALSRYVFRSKVKVAARDDLQVLGAFATPELTASTRIAGDEVSGIELDMSADGGARRMLVGTHSAAANDAGVKKWAAFDMTHGLPRLPDEQSSQWTPQQLSLERLHAFSVKKGCYPGQEIVARTHFLGKAKRGLMLVEGDRPLIPGAQLREIGSGTGLGTLVSCARASEGRYLALVVAPLDREPVGLGVDGIEVREATLLEGLAR
ncbi:MAG: folate-binding protein [Pseudomonadota bacterium]|nr:folate-binding protein [Pseudomonadota bacterium]